LLIVSVSFQVIEMFYVTPPYPAIYARYLPITIFALLLLNIPLFFIAGDSAAVIDYFVILLLAIHAVVTLRRLYQKKRPLKDATFMFWNLAMGSFLLFALSLLLGLFVPLPITLSAAAFSYFALSAIFAMSYKIVPFLVWFHLNAKGYFDAPMMHEVVDPKYAKLNLYLFTASFLLLLLAPFFPLFWKAGALFWTASFAMLFWAILGGIKKYNFTLKNGTKFDFGAPAT
jgi:predicted ABC-type exoprotein transport system permease subunit